MGYQDLCGLASNMYCSPELWYQYLNLLGGQPAAGKRKTPIIIGGHEAMDIVNDKVYYINLDTTKMVKLKSCLQMIAVKVEDQLNLDFLLDGGAVVSVLQLHLIRQLGKEQDIQPTNKTLRYGGGVLYIPVGVVDLKL